MAKAKAKAPQGPHLAMAFVCERILVEKDDVMTFIRVVDQMTMPRPAEEFPQNAVLALGYSLVISFKSGNFRGKKQLKVESVGPNGQRKLFIAAPVDFSGDLPEGGYTGGIAMHIKWDGEGHYRFDVFLDDDLVTSVPVNIMLAKEKPPQQVSRKSRKAGA